LTEQRPRFVVMAIACVLMAMLVLAGVAVAADRQRVSRVSVVPGGSGSPSKPKPVQIGFGLSVAAERPSLRPKPIKTYAIGIEGVLAFPQAFPSCSLGHAKIRGGPARTCKRAQVGSGLIRAAAGLQEDPGMADSLPCNLKLRLYNTGAGAALRVDTGPPQPRDFKSRKLGCPVPIHTAIRGQFAKTTIDGLASNELRFTLPKLLLRPLEGWEGALQLVDASLIGDTAPLRVKGRMREVGYLSAVGCRGKDRTARAAFIDESGVRTEATRTVGC
jgi:hypothetical protein